MKVDRYEQKKKRMSMILTIGIAFIMIASIFAIVIGNQSQGPPTYNKHSFMYSNIGYKTKINGTYQEFYYYPSELERIPMGNDTIEKLRSSQGIGFIFDPKDNITDNLQYVDLLRYDLVSQMDKPVYFGITQNSSDSRYPLPVVDCKSATEMFPLILINASSQTGFIESADNPNCIIMNGRLRELLAAKDRFIYTYYGIMN